MKKQGKYSTSRLVEDQYMPGSGGQVLKNRLNITTKDEIDRIETELLFVVTEQLLDELDTNHCLSADDIMQMHRRWLGHTEILLIHPFREGDGRRGIA